MDIFMYKIEPFIISKSSAIVKRKKRIICKIDFHNKGIDMINLPRIFRSKTLKSFVNFLDIKEPSVVYNSVDDISSRIFNYNNVVKYFDEPSLCVCSQFSEFIHIDCGHVVTGNLDIVRNVKLRNILSKGPKFKEPRTIDFDENHRTVLENVKLFLVNWSSKEQVPLENLNGWYIEFERLMCLQTADLKSRYSKGLKQQSVFEDKLVIEELDFFKAHFVLCPVDKASKNVAIICRNFYISNILDECSDNSGIINCSRDLSEIVKCQNEFLDSINIDRSSCKDTLPHMFSSPKFHKPSLKMRYIVSYSNCSIKPLAKMVTLGLKAIFSEICRYSNMLQKVTGINRNWIILNNGPILDVLNYINNNSVARNVETYDFSTLYTKLRHEDIINALNFVIKLAFRNNKSKCIAIYSSSSRWVNTPRSGTFVFEQESLMKSISFLLENCYFTVGDSIFKQIIGVPIGVDAGPYIANLTLWYFENKFLESTYKSKYFVAKKLTRTYRLIDDITSINSDGCFESCFKAIYPDSLELNKENSNDKSACVLDLDIKIVDGKFKCSVYDKRDDFNFNIVQFQPLCSNQARSVSYGVFTSQLIRYFRICTDIESFSERVIRIFDEFIKLGYTNLRLVNLYKQACIKHSFCKKFGKSCNDILAHHFIF